MKYESPGASFEAVANWHRTGLAGTLAVRLTDNAGATVIARTTTGVIETPAGSGIYAVSLTAPTIAGDYSIVWDDGTTFESEDLTVTSSAVVAATPAARDLITLAEAKAWMKITATTDDTVIQRLITAASRAIHEAAEREFVVVGSNPQTRDFDLDTWIWYADRTVPVGDMSAVTSASILSYGIDGTLADTTPVTNLIARPRIREEWEPITDVQFPLSFIAPLLMYRPVFRVVGSWGFPAIPQDIKQACMDTVSFWFDRNVEEYQSDFGATQAEGAQTVIIGRGQTPTQILPLPPMVQAIVDQYRRLTLV